MSRFYFQKGHLYIVISNNRENLAVMEFMCKELIGNSEMVIMRDIITGEEGFCMASLIAYTEKRFKTLSKLTHDEVIELFYQREFEYEYVDNEHTVKFDYIDPMENFKLYSKKAKEFIEANQMVDA